MVLALKRRELLQQLVLGNAVAEYDDELERFFVETNTFNELLSGERDTIAGDKGTGKTAIFRILCRKYREYRQLENVEVLRAVNPRGDPTFQRLTYEGEPLSEGQYITVWKAYIISLVGNYILKIFEGQFGANMTALDEMLRRTGLHSADDSPNTIFNAVANLARRLTQPESVEGAVTLTPQGLPIISGRVEFGTGIAVADAEKFIPHDEALNLLERVLDEAGIDIWLAFDRLDEAFQGHPAVETPALRALFRTQLDLADLNHVWLKLFVRRDLFRRIIQGGFVNLTHINARKAEIVWDDADPVDLLGRRICDSAALLASLGLQGRSPEEVFDVVFPPQVDVAERKPTTKNWMMSRIRDGNGIKPPRNLLDLVIKAREAEIRREEREKADTPSSSALASHPGPLRALRSLATSSSWIRYVWSHSRRS
jgi:hypothetical protein